MVELNKESILVANNVSMAYDDIQIKDYKLNASSIKADLLINSYNLSTYDNSLKEICG